MVNFHLFNSIKRPIYFSSLWIDGFMDADPLSNKSFYRIYSNQGPLYKGSYQYTLKTNDNDTYSFVGIDMVPRPGPGRPFNFLGYINKV